ncbi:MAG TPA: roadblock/LC7 domain-containing protein, partial [Gemmatimonadaceae bacterium]
PAPGRTAGASAPSAPGPAPRTPQDARYLFADVIGDGEQTALLLDEQGLVMAGAYVSADGRDVAQDVGAELSGVSDEARRAMRHLDLGNWTAIVFETEVATVAMAPAPQDGLLLVASSREAPLGFVRRLLDRASERTRLWLGVA